MTYLFGSNRIEQTFYHGYNIGLGRLFCENEGCVRAATGSIIHEGKLLELCTQCHNEFVLGNTIERFPNQLFIRASTFIG